MGQSKPKNWAAGHWLIESLDQWAPDFVDEEVRDYFVSVAESPGGCPSLLSAAKNLACFAGPRRSFAALRMTEADLPQQKLLRLQGAIRMSSKGRQTPRKPATKFAHLRKKMEKARLVNKISKKK